MRIRIKQHQVLFYLFSCYLFVAETFVCILLAQQYITIIIIIDDLDLNKEAPPPPTTTTTIDDIQLMDLQIMEVVPASECWKMTVDNVIDRIKTKNSTAATIAGDSLLASHFCYLSERFGGLTYEQLTKQFIAEYSETSHSQMVENIKFEKKKSKLLYDYLACQLLVFRTEDTKFEYITTSIREIRK